MKCENGRTNSRLWAAAKKAAMAEACRGKKRRCGQWDARIAQRAGKIYRDRGGGYCGAKTKAQRGLTKWTKEEWTTATGERACRKVGNRFQCDRYLPKKAWERLSPAEKAETRRRKLAAKTQFVPNAPAAKRAGARARRSK